MLTEESLLPRRHLQVGARFLLSRAFTCKALVRITRLRCCNQTQHYLHHISGQPAATTSGQVAVPTWFSNLSQQVQRRFSTAQQHAQQIGTQVRAASRDWKPPDLSKGLGECGMSLQQAPTAVQLHMSMIKQCRATAVPSIYKPLQHVDGCAVTANMFDLHARQSPAAVPMKLPCKVPLQYQL